MIRLNIGCGRDYRKGWLNIDISREVEADYYMDIRKDSLTKGRYFGEIRGEPQFTDGPTITNAADEIYISGVLEQIGSNDELIFVMNECWEALKVGGKMTVIVPNAKHGIAHRDPMDVRKFTKATFNYFNVDCYEYRDYGSVYGFKPWRVEEICENERHILTVTMFKHGG